MAVSNDLLIKIQADTSQAAAKISEIEKRISSLSQTGERSAQAFSNFTGTIGKLGAASIALNQGLDLTYKVFNDLLKPVSDAVVAFQRHQDVLAKLSATLSFVGETNVPEAARQFERLSQSIEDMIGVDDKAVLSLVSMAKASGLTSDQVKKLATTAADFSAGAGIGFEQAFMALQKSLKGSAVGIATFRPELKNMTAEQLKAGQAIDYIKGQYEGFGNLMAGSFGVSLLRAADSVEDLQKAVGGLISDFIPVQRALEAATATIRDFAKFIAMIPNDLGAFSTAYQVVKFFADGLVSSFDMVFETVSRSLILVAEVVTTGFNALATGVLATVQSLSERLAGISLIPDSWVTSLKGLTDRFAANTKNSFDRVAISARAVKDALMSVPQGQVAQAAASVKAGKAPGGMRVVDQEALKELDQLKAKTLEIQVAAASFGKTQREQIAIRLKGELDILEAQKKQLLLAGKKDQAAEIQKQMAAKKDLAGKQTAAAPASAYEGMVLAGQDMAKEISGQMSEGMAGSIAGAAAAANSVLDAVQGLIDLGPQVLNKIANIFSSLADLPDKLLEAVMNIDTALGKFIDKFPDALVKLFSKLPELVGSILEKLGALMPTLSEALFRAIPQLIVSLIKQAPRIGIAMAKGFIDATRSLVKGLFDGSIFKMPKIIDAASAGAEIKKIARQLTEEASKVFAVLDFAEGGKRADTVVAKVEAAAKKTQDKMAEMWRAIEVSTQRFFDSAGRFVSGIPAAFSRAWQDFENAIGPFFSGIFQIFASILSGLFDAQRWNTAFQSIISAFEATIGRLGTNIWAGLKAGLESGAQIFQNIGRAIGDVIGTAVTSAVNFVMQPIKDMFNVFIDILNNMKLSEVRWRIDAGRLGSASGTLIPEIDLIPGDIQRFAAGGMVPGYGNSDSVPALLTPGEFVLNKRAAASLGLPALQALNGSGSSAGGSVIVNQQFEIHVESKEALDEAFIKARLVPAIKKELKRASLDGQFVLAATGVRT